MRSANTAPELTEAANSICPGIKSVGAAATFTREGGEFALRDDVAVLGQARCVAPPPELGVALPLSLRLGDAYEDSAEEWISLPTGGFLVPGPPDEKAHPALGPIVRAIIEDREGAATEALEDTVLPSGWRLTGGAKELHLRTRRLCEEAARWGRLADRDFANSAPYMGTKRQLLPLIMTTLETMLPDTRAFVDLMCGSGVVAGAASRRWRTVASDAQSFCRSLAVVQGGGFSVERAADTLRQLQEPTLTNLAALSERVRPLIVEESGYLTAASDWHVLAPRYADFIARTPGFPGGGSSGDWDPVAEVQRRQDGLVAPYCLMTAYFANLYFGVRQALELDSLRYAIDQLSDESQREWALGALVVTASAVATTYGGHFAQPPAPPKRLTSADTTRRILAQRHRSVTREFEIRLLSLATESEDIAHRIEPVVGPWQSALDQTALLLRPRGTIVYVDAPYRREEYSRYYHVLETLMSYDYPSASTPARLPRKGSERFASEFFTRNRTNMAQALINTLRGVLERGFDCAWSYADRADADALEVLEGVSGQCRRIQSVAADHEYKRQGRSRTAGRVREYLFVLESASA